MNIFDVSFRTLISFFSTVVGLFSQTLTERKFWTILAHYKFNVIFQGAIAPALVN